MMLSPHESLAALNFELTHDDADRRCLAMRQLAQSGRKQTGVTARVILLVADGNEETREWACEALESAIMPMPNEVNDLIQVLRETRDGEVEYWTATMLGRLGVVASGATAVLASCLLDSPSLAARERAAWALSEIGPAARSAMNALRQIGPEDPPRLQRLASSAIQSLIGRAA